MNYFVEGLQGSGKNTMVQKLSEKYPEFVRENMYIQQIRNATLKIKYGSCTFLIDPWFQDQGTGFSAKTVKPEMHGDQMSDKRFAGCSGKDSKRC